MSRAFAGGCPRDCQAGRPAAMVTAWISRPEFQSTRPAAIVSGAGRTASAEWTCHRGSYKVADHLSPAAAARAAVQRSASCSAASRRAICSAKPRAVGSEAVPPVSFDAACWSLFCQRWRASPNQPFSAADAAARDRSRSAGPGPSIPVSPGSAAGLAIGPSIGPAIGPATRPATRPFTPAVAAKQTPTTVVRTRRDVLDRLGMATIRGAPDAPGRKTLFGV